MPFSSVPVELLQTIFRLACTPPIDQSRAGRVKILTPVVVSHVCKTWREVAISDSFLWMDPFFCVTADSTWPNVSMVDVYLERSRNRPLNVTLKIAEYDTDSPQGANSHISALFSNFNRWKTANVFIEHDEMTLYLWQKDVDCKLREGAPLLETLEVLCEVFLSQFPASSVLPTLLWSHAPQLTKLAIQITDIVPSDIISEWYADVATGPDPDDSDAEDVGPTIDDEWPLGIGIPYDQLTHLRLDTGPKVHLTWDDIGIIFDRARNLVSCSLEGINRFSEYTPTLPPRVVLEHLRHLYLSGEHNKDVNRDSIKIHFVPSLNQILTAPSLQSLYLINNKELWDSAAYTDFITRSDCPLSEIHFYPLTTNDQDILFKWLSLSSTTLRIVSSNQMALISSQFACQMSEWDSRAGEFELCPNLEEISIDIPNLARSVMGDPFYHIVPMLKKRHRRPDDTPGLFRKLSVPSDIKRLANLPSIRQLANTPHPRVRIQLCDPDFHARMAWDRD